METQGQLLSANGGIAIVPFRQTEYPDSNVHKKANRKMIDLFIFPTVTVLVCWKEVSEYDDCEFLNLW